jgi:hypothetical protein
MEIWELTFLIELKGQLTARDNILRLKLLSTFGNMEISKYGYIEISKYRNIEIWDYGNIEHGNIGVCNVRIPL